MVIGSGIVGLTTAIFLKKIGILGVGNSKMPITNWHSDNIFLAWRMGGMGIALGSYIGDKTSDLFSKNDKKGFVWG
jgi:hypothetical protein